MIYIIDISENHILQDKSWTVTLFMPFVNFESIQCAGGLMEFFETNFPDAIPLIGKKKLIADFFKTTPQRLVSIKVRLTSC